MIDTALVGKLAGVVSLAAFVPYAFAIIKGTTKPHRATWIIWTLVGFMLAASYYASGAKDTIWVSISFVLGPLLILVLSIKYGKGGWEPLDRVCLFGVLASLVLWWISGSALAALLINIFIDFLGAIPTIKKVYLKPETEDRFAWTLFLVGSVANLSAIEVWTFVIYVYPVYMIALDVIVMTLIFNRRNRALAIL